jgi:cell division protein FtsN
VTESARKPAAAPRRSGIAAETMADRAPESTEKLTFYKTLTAPLDGPGTPTKPEAKPVSVKIPAVSPLPPAPSFTDAPKPAPARPIAEPPSLPPRPGKTAGSGPAAEGPWTIQVGAYKNRRQADDSRRQLASAGLDAYVVALAAQDGAARYRVRVGTYPTREEAATAAERLRTQRSLTTFVTPR